ncbi:DNA-deoxyinosine glycosylase [Allofournierella sp.]|uniref:DNA-deoxyinosine glycosylase n=1 Tax=Allofournierella sp. TaxID=1940256 RepID=UPI002E77714D|nr:DNA-deoxyinosine glycosylase [Fournierella sp.]MEE0756437.1 DNA-deoxyinosine glycosylase [Fournierella sp.]
MSFEPVFGPASRALILGSWPSPESWRQGFYYGHPRNRFWPLLARLCGVPAPATVEEKRALILQNGLVLWDVLERCTVTGAQDASIKDPVPVDLAALLEKAPVEAVFCNGATAFRLYEKLLRPACGIAAVRLPSTSPANAAFGMEKLAAAWGAALGPWLSSPH